MDSILFLVLPIVFPGIFLRLFLFLPGLHHFDSFFIVLGNIDWNYSLNHTKLSFLIKPMLSTGTMFSWLYSPSQSVHQPEIIICKNNLSGNKISKQIRSKMCRCSPSNFSQRPCLSRLDDIFGWHINERSQTEIILSRRESGMELARDAGRDPLKLPCRLPSVWCTRIFC